MKRNLFSMLFIVITLGLIVFIAFSNSELTDAWSALFTLDVKWLLMALLGWVSYVFFDTLSLHYFLRKQKHPISLGSACFVSLSGFYYSNITPGASGGQPMQVYYMSKRGVPVPIGTSTISIKFFAQQLMLVLLTGLFWWLNAGYVNAQLGGMKWAMYIGFGINFAAIPLILLIALHRPMVQTIITFFIHLGAKMRILKHPEDKIVRMNAGLDMYHASILRLTNHPSQIVGMMLLVGLSILGMMSVPLSVYYAFRMSGTPWYHVMAVSFLLFISASYTPLPGASGAQEGGFLVYFGSMFTQGTIGLALLVWRFFTYYLFLIVGGIMSIAGNLRSNRRRDKEAKSKAAADAAAAPEADTPAPEPDASQEIAPEEPKVAAD